MMMHRFVAILDNIRSLHNVGAIFRTADGAGVEKLYLCGITGTPPRAEIRKAALGAEQSVLWEYHNDTHAVIDSLKKQGYHLVALERMKESQAYDRAMYEFPLALILGHEYDGLSEDILACCDKIISIPMRGKKISLNVSVAFGIAAYEIAKQLK